MRFEAVALFVDRARAARPDFALDSRSAPLVAEIVARLDGLPLAIEFAAARIRLLSVEGIRDRLGSRLGLLTGGAHDLPERQRTLRNAIEWSHDLLDDEHRRLFAAWQCSWAGLPSSMRRQSAGPASASKSSTASRPSETRVCYVASSRLPSRDFSCSRRSVNTLWNVWPPVGKKRSSGKGTPVNTWRWPSRPPPSTPGATSEPGSIDRKRITTT